MPIDKEFKSLRAFALFLEDGVARDKAARRRAARTMAELLAATIRLEYGLRGEGWIGVRGLRPATIETRGNKIDSPLLDSGAGLRDNVRAHSREALATAVNDHPIWGPIAAMHEYGFHTHPFGNKNLPVVAVPPRPVFRNALMVFALQQRMHKLMGDIARHVIGETEGKN